MDNWNWKLTIGNVSLEYQPFQQNMEDASSLLEELTTLHSSLLESLEKEGVYLADSSDVLAVEFGKAANNFQIGGLKLP